MTSLAAIAPKLAPLVRMLSSPIDGEALGAARALGRVLTGAGLDFHTLADFVESATPRPSVYRPSPAYADAYSRPASPQTAPKSKRQRNPWPTFSTLKHSQRCAWLDEMNKRSHIMERKAYAKFFDLKQKMITRPHEILSRREIAQFNLLVKMLWFMEVRV